MLLVDFQVLLFLFLTHTFREMLKLVDQNVLFTILYSDDILLASTSVEELKKALEILDRLLATFILALDHSKTQFIRTSDELLSEIDVLYNRQDGTWSNIIASKRMKWLGFYLRDCDIFNIQLHLRDRIISCGRKEMVVLKWMCNTFASTPSTIKS